MSDSNAGVADKGIFSRAIGVIVSPGETFQVVTRFPRPAGILFLVCLVLGLATGLPQFSAKGRETLVNAQMTQLERSGQPVSADTRARVETFSHYAGYATIVSVFVSVPVITVILCGLYWGIFNTVLGGTASFKQVLGVIAHAQVITALGAVIGAPVQYMSPTANMAGPFNLGAIAPMLDPASAVARLLANISVFSLWQIVVSAIGLGVLYRRSTGFIAVFLLAVYLVVMTGVTLGLSSFSQR